MTDFGEFQAVAEFFRSMEAMKDAYVGDRFSYVAIERNGEFQLLQGRLLRATVPVPENWSSSVQVGGMRVGRFALAEVDLSVEEYLAAAFAGKVPTPDGDLRFFQGGNDFRVHHEPHHRENLTNNDLFNVLFIAGGEIDPPFVTDSLNWELRALTEPYDGVHELLMEYGLLPLRTFGNIETIAHNVVAFHMGSAVKGNQALLGLFLAKGIPTEHARLGYRLIARGQAVSRGSLSGDVFRWEDGEAHLRGSTEIEVPPAAVLQCFASYAGTVQHFGWVGDPTSYLNPHRAAYAVFDDSLDVIKDFLFSEVRRRDARDVEIGVAWLLWLLGFSSAHLGVTPRTQDFADLLATTPNGQMCVIECTTGLLKAENKLPHLVDRTERVRRKLQASNHGHIRVLPIIVTTKTREEIKADQEQAERLGVLVLTRENLEQLIERSLLPTNPDQLFSEAEASVEEARLKHNTKPD